jgi:hypothetical protein
MKPPYRTFAVDYVALPHDFSMMLQKDGRHTGEIEFTTFVYDPDGKLLNVSDKEIKMSFSPETYKRFMANPVRLQLKVSAPVKQETFLRLIIRDVPSNHYGAVEIPTAQVGHLPPLEAQNGPSHPPAAEAAATKAKPAGTQ